MYNQNQKPRIRMTEVFTPGGFPTITYIARKEKLEERVSSAGDNIAKAVIVSGITKSGKTVLVDKVFPQESSIWIEGGTISNENSFWETIIERANVYNEIEVGESRKEGEKEKFEASVTGNAIVAKGEVNEGWETEAEKTNQTIMKRNVNPKVLATLKLQELKKPLVVDDFHYIDKSIQKSIVRALKASIMRGVPVIFIAIPTRRYETIEVEREMTGRIESIEMPVWEEDELCDIARQGFKSLNVNVDVDIISRLAQQSYGSPFLMQEFCRALCEKCAIVESSEKEKYISNDISLDEIFTDIAEHSGRNMFDKIKRGPRARADRKKRILKNGEETDIYGVVLEGLKTLKPGMESMSYEELRNQIKEVLGEDPPQKNEISRVLDQIAKISHTDTSSEPVIDWQRDDDIITITDPFFAFFLNWAS